MFTVTVIDSKVVVCCFFVDVAISVEGGAVSQIHFHFKMVRQLLKFSPTLK